MADCKHLSFEGDTCIRCGRFVGLCTDKEIAEALAQTKQCPRVYLRMTCMEGSCSYPYSEAMCDTDPRVPHREAKNATKNY